MKGLQLLTILVLLVVTVQVASGKMQYCNKNPERSTPCEKPMCCAQGKGDINGWCSVGQIGEECGGTDGHKCHKDLKCALRNPSDPQSTWWCKCKSDSGLTRGNLTA